MLNLLRLIFNIVIVILFYDINVVNKCMKGEWSNKICVYVYILLCINIKIKFWFVLIYKILCYVNNKGFLFVWLLKI